jgi:hypothetical protein
MFPKRLWICILGGVLSAVICLVGCQIAFGFPKITWDTVAATVANRLLLDFVIGISG